MAKQLSHRRKHRQQSHKKSHAQGAVAPILQGHALVPTGAHEWIETETELETLCKKLELEKTFAFDTEFIGEESYYPHTCLIQIATTKQVSLIDPLKIKQLSPLHAVICNPNITTVVHAGSQDFEPIFRLFGTRPSGIFDTQIAAGLAGLPWPLSLTKTISNILQHDVSGHFTFSQWDARPLTKRQIHYASDDVRYLLAIHDALTKQIEALHRMDWIQEECQKITAPELYGFNVRQVIKKICRNKSPKKQDLQRMQALAIIRDTIAQKMNLPPKDVVPNECILFIAKNNIQSSQELAAIKGFPKNIANQYGEEILKVLVDSHKLDAVLLRKPHKIESEPKMRQELDGVWALFNAYCIGNKLAPSLVSNRQNFTDWYLPLRLNESNQSSTFQGWRADVLNEFGRILEKNNSMSFKFNDGLIAE